MSLVKALIALSPNAKWQIINGVLEWQSPEIQQPTQEEINQKITELAASQLVLPNWANFMAFMDTSGYFAKGLTTNFPVFTQLFNLLTIFTEKKTIPNDTNVQWRNFAFTWQYFGKSVFTESELLDIQSKMGKFNIPVI